MAIATSATAAAAIAIQPATDELKGYPLEDRLKNTGYVWLLLPSSFSPGTLAMFTCTDAVAPKADGGRLRFAKETVTWCCGAIEATSSVLVTTDFPETTTRSVTGTLTDWIVPEFWSVTLNMRFAETSTVVGVDVERVFVAPADTASVLTRALPLTPPVVPPPPLVVLIRL